MKRVASGLLAEILAVTFLFGVVGCGTKKETSAKPIEIEVAFWGAPDELDIMTKIIEEWQKTRSDISVKLEHTPYRGYIDKLLTRIAGRSAPDIICTEVDYFVTFQSKGVLLDLTPFIEKDKELNINDFYPEIIDRFTSGGRLYALPRDTAPFACVYYNKNIFDEAGVPYPTDNWDVYDLLDKAKKLTKFDAEGRVIRYGYYAWAWQNFVYAFGGRIVDDVKNPKKFTMDSENAVKGLNFYTDMIIKHKVHPTTTAMTNMAMGVQGMFMTGRLAMFTSGIWETPGLRKIGNFDWDVAMFPKGPGGIRAFGTGGTGYCILKGTKNPKEAYEVLKALTNRGAQEMLAKTGLAQPAIMDVAFDWADDGRIPKNKKMLLEAMKYVVYEPFHPAWREAKELYIIPSLDKVFNGKESAEASVGEIRGKVNELLGKGQD